MPETLTMEYARGLLPTRPNDAHKFHFGRVLVVAGSPQYPGAAALATAGAARVGAGLVCLATGRSGMGGPGRIPEVVYTIMPEAEWGALGEPAADELLKQIVEYQALLIGPGIGREQPTRQFLWRMLGLDAPRRKPQIGFRIGTTGAEDGADTRPDLPPIVLDADALNLLSKQTKAAEELPQRGDFFQRNPAAASDEEDMLWWEHLPRGRAILTPHAGEMARLLGVSELTGDPAMIAADAAAKWGQIVLLKGPQTVIAHPEGRVIVHDKPNVALATAGSGDVLAGAIAGFLAQGLLPFDAAALGVYLHSAAGQSLRADMGDAGGLASDLLPRMPLVIRELRGSM